MQIRLDQILKCSNTWEWDGTEIVDNHNDSLPNVHLRPGKSGLQQGWWWLGTKDDDLNDDNDEDDDNDDDDDDDDNDDNDEDDDNDDKAPRNKTTGTLFKCWL